MNFSWAMDLDPKGANNQIKEAIDKRYVTDEDDPSAGMLAILVCSTFVTMCVQVLIFVHG